MEILPAIIGFSITGIFILISVFSVKFPDYNENPPGILISSFIFIASGFIFEIIYSKWYLIQSWTQKNSNITFVFTIVGTFCTNRFLKKLADDKEKREISVLLRNSIDSQIISLQFINYDLLYNPIQDKIHEIKIYKNNLLTSKIYDIALNKIGIYDEKDIDIISTYSTELQQCLNYIERLLMKVEEGQVNYHEIFQIVKVSILTTSMFGIFTSYYLPKRYLNNNFGISQETFFKDYEQFLDDFKTYLQRPQDCQLYSMNRILADDLFKKLEYIRNNFIESSSNYNMHNRKPIYIYRLPLKKEIRIVEKDIVVFGESPEDAKINGENIMEDLKNKFNLEPEIQYDDIEPKIISPWG